MKKTTSILLLAALTTVTASANDTKPFQLSLTPDVSLYSTNTTIEGVALNIWGENKQRALNLGVINGSRGDSSGLSWALLANYSDNYTGAQLGLVNYNKGSFKGLQWGGVNYTNNLEGAQWGFVNYSKKVSKGLQLGVVNYAENMTQGLQIGLINVIGNNNSWFTKVPDSVAPAMVFVNWRF